MVRKLKNGRAPAPKRFSWSLREEVIVIVCALSCFLFVSLSIHFLLNIIEFNPGKDSYLVSLGTLLVDYFSPSVLLEEAFTVNQIGPPEI